jgi:dihydrofolate synthase/folylpolyglutamate synthase
VAPLYSEALAWLYRATRNSQPRDPARMARLMATLGLTPPPRSVHVVGTSGKGTVSAMLAHVLQASGQRVGRFLSPHVEEFTERIAVNGCTITPEAVTAFVSRLPAQSQSVAFFELTLALALTHFAQQAIDIAVIEAGVGARNDATIVLKPVVCTVITTIGHDHLEVIGPTLRDVAWDKAAAIRPGVPVVTGAAGVGLEVISTVARTQGSQLYRLDPDDPLFALPSKLPPSDATREQNQRLAAAACRLLGITSDTVLATGLALAPLPARRELFSVQGRTVLLDGAHNPCAAQALRATLTGPYLLLFGALPRKDGEATLAVLEPAAIATFITDVDKQASTLSRLPSRTYIADPLAALSQALARCPKDATLVVTGSLYLAGQVRPWLRNNLAAGEKDSRRC